MNDDSPEIDRLSGLLVSLGRVTGGLLRKDTRKRLIESVRTGGLNSDYLRQLRDALDDVLRECEAGKAANGS